MHISFTLSGFVGLSAGLKDELPILANMCNAVRRKTVRAGKNTSAVLIIEITNIFLKQRKGPLNERNLGEKNV